MSALKLAAVTTLQSLSIQLMKPNNFCNISHLCSTTVSLGTFPLWLKRTQLLWYKKLDKCEEVQKKFHSTIWMPCAVSLHGQQTSNFPWNYFFTCISVFYQNNQMEKVNKPTYLITLKTEVQYKYSLLNFFISILVSMFSHLNFCNRW